MMPSLSIEMPVDNVPGDTPLVWVYANFDWSAGETGPSHVTVTSDDGQEVNATASGGNAWAAQMTLPDASSVTFCAAATAEDGSVWASPVCGTLDLAGGGQSGGP